MGDGGVQQTQPKFIQDGIMCMELGENWPCCKDLGICWVPIESMCASYLFILACNYLVGLTNEIVSPIMLSIEAPRLVLT